MIVSEIFIEMLKIKGNGRIMILEYGDILKYFVRVMIRKCRFRFILIGRLGCGNFWCWFGMKYWIVDFLCN